MSSAFLNTNTGKLVIPDAKIFFRNFAGKESKYNRDGNRNFCVNIEDSVLASKLIDDGWNVKISKPRDEDEEPRYYIQVSVSYKFRPPTIVTHTGRVTNELDEETVEMLDYADIVGVDMVVNPSHWEVNGKEGVKAYLDNMHVVLEEDYFAAKYAEEEYPGELPF